MDTSGNMELHTSNAHVRSEVVSSFCPTETVSEMPILQNTVKNGTNRWLQHICVAPSHWKNKSLKQMRKFAKISFHLPCSSYLYLYSLLLLQLPYMFAKHIFEMSQLLNRMKVLNNINYPVYYLVELKTLNVCVCIRNLIEIKLKNIKMHCFI